MKKNEVVNLKKERYQANRTETSESDQSAIMMRLKNILERERAPYRVIRHSRVYTAPELAASIHTTGRRVAKVVVVQADKQFVMIILPSNRILDMTSCSKEIGAKHVSLATETEMEKLFPDCELGAMPPFGYLYGLRVYMDDSMTREPEIFFQAGSHHKVIQMAYVDFKRIVRPDSGRFAAEPLGKVSGF